MKDDLGGKIIKKFIGIRSKTYSEGKKGFPTTFSPVPSTNVGLSP